MDQTAPLSDSGARPWSSLPGPVDRVSFFDEQRRNRRSTWLLSGLCLLAIFFVGLGVSAVVSPMLYAFVALAGRLVGGIVPIPPGFWEPLRAVVGQVEPLIEALDAPPASPAVVVGHLLTLCTLLLPGMVTIVLLWLALRALFLRAGVGGVLLSLGAREPRDGDLEEEQLVNVVAEMAIAAGLQPPRVMLLDAGAANAAAVGSGPHDATVVVSRRLLDELDRDETQGVLAHLIGSIGNGDLGIALTIVSLFQAFGLLATLLEAPFSRHARGALWRLARFALTRRRDGAEADLVMALLSRGLGDENVDEMGKLLEVPPAAQVGHVRAFLLNARMLVLLPLFLATLFAKMVLLIYGSFLLGPAIAFTWRTRRHLADATAVQLTRNPDGLARALGAMTERGGVLPGGQWAEHLFVVRPTAVSGRAQAHFQQRLAELREQTKDRPGLERARAALEAAQSQRAELAAADDAERRGSFGERNFGLVGFHPSLESRFKQLQRLGAHLATGRRPKAGHGLALTLGVLVLSPLLLLLAWLILVALALVGMLALLCFVVGMAVVMVLLPR